MHATTKQLIEMRDGQPVDSDLAGHVELCEKCSHKLKLVRWNKQALIDLPQYAPSPQVFTQLSERLVNEQKRSSQPNHRQPLQWAAAAAVVAALALWFVPDRNDGLTQIAQAPTAETEALVATNERVRPGVSAADIALRDELLGRSTALEAVAGQLAALGTMQPSRSTDEALVALEAQLALVDYNLSAAQIDQYVPAELIAMLSRRVNTLENIVGVQRAELARQGYHGFQVMTASNLEEDQTW